MPAAGAHSHILPHHGSLVPLDSLWQLFIPGFNAFLPPSPPSRAPQIPFSSHRALPKREQGSAPRIQARGRGCWLRSTDPAPAPPVETGAEPPAPAPLPAPDRDSLFCREVNHRLCPQTPGPCTSRLQRLPWLQHLPPQPACAAAEPPAGSRQTPGTPAWSQDTNSSHRASSGQHFHGIPIPFGYLPGGTKAIRATLGTSFPNPQPPAVAPSSTA